MNKPLISIVLPVYNVEKYLEKCIQTVVNQSYKNIEIIIVNDGATDNSVEICDLWEKKDSRIKVIHKKNAGLGLARNTGIEHATGQYIVFIDSDDFIDLNMIEKLVKGLNGCDTVFCGYYVYYNKDRVEKKIIKYAGLRFEGTDIKNKILIEMMGAMPSDEDDIILPVSVWHGMYSMELINKNNIRFPSEREFISEDMIFDIDYFSVSKSVSFIPECLYYYRKNNENSLTTIYNSERFKKEIILFEELERKLLMHLPRDKFELRLQRTFLGRVRSCIVRAIKQCKSPRNEIKIICNNKKVQTVLNEYPYGECKLDLRLFNFCVKHSIVTILWIMVKIKNYANKQR